MMYQKFRIKPGLESSQGRLLRLESNPDYSNSIGRVVSITYHISATVLVCLYVLFW